MCIRDRFCTSPGVILGLDERAADTLQADLAERAPAPMLTDGIAAAFVDGAEARTGMTLDPGQPAAVRVSATRLAAEDTLWEELFGPIAVVAGGADRQVMLDAARSLDGQLTASIFADPGDHALVDELTSILIDKVGRIILNDVPTGVAVTPAMHHGGPYPAATSALHTSVGTAAIERFAKPVCFQGFDGTTLPDELQDANPRGIMRQVDGVLTRD